MGTIYFGLCHDCRTFIDLDKFDGFAAYEDESIITDGFVEVDPDTMAHFRSGAFVYRSLRLQFFMHKHRDHRIGVHTEHSVERFGWYEEGDPTRPRDGPQGWTEQFHWPRPGVKKK